MTQTTNTSPLAKYEHLDTLYPINMLKIPVTTFEINDEGAEAFNEVYFYVRDHYPATLKLTPSGGISTNPKKLYLPAYTIRETKSIVELILISLEGQFRFQFRAFGDPKKNLPGSVAFGYLRREFKKDGIDINEYAIKNGREIKGEIQKYHRRCFAITDVVYKHVYHLDFNSAFAANLARAYPELRPTLERLYNERAEKPINKHILTNAIGYMQSVGAHRGAIHANLSKAAVNGTCEIVEKYLEILRNSDYVPLSTNVDGIWYADPHGHGAYHDSNEGHGFGQWKTDFASGEIRYKHGENPACTYEFKGIDCETGKEVYKPVYTGLTMLDRTKPRNKWVWGDIYQEGCRAYQFKFNKEKGAYKL